MGRAGSARVGQRVVDLVADRVHSQQLRKIAAAVGERRDRVVDGIVRIGGNQVRLPTEIEKEEELVPPVDRASESLPGRRWWR